MVGDNNLRSRYQLDIRTSPGSTCPLCNKSVGARKSPQNWCRVTVHDPASGHCKHSSHDFTKNSRNTETLCKFALARASHLQPGPQQISAHKKRKRKIKSVSFYVGGVKLEALTAKSTCIFIDGCTVSE